MDHRIIDGQVFRVVQLEAADTLERHIMKERPISPQEQRVYLATLEEQDQSA